MKNYRNELIAFIRGLEVPDAGVIDDDTPLLESGVLDSLAFFQLALWIERQIGGKLDPATFDLQQEWRTVRSIVAFIERWQTVTR